jgi:hypothetical protein
MLMTRDQLEKRTGLDVLIEAALEGAPSESAFEMLLMPSKLLAGTGDEVAAAIDRLRKVRGGERSEDAAARS